MSDLVKKISLWRVITVAIFAAGLYASYLRYFRGWQIATNLSDAQPWGIWVGLATLCGVGLSAGGFAIAAAVYLLGLERYHSVARVSVLISLLGYSTVCVGYLYELGLPWRAWHVFIYWNHRSVLFDVCLCIMTYTTVLVLEFAPQVLEKLPWTWAHKLAEFQHRFVIGIVLAGTLLSSMHQSFLGGLFLIMKGHIYPLWYSQYIHTMFYLSAIPAGLSMVIIAMYLCMRSMNVKVDYSVMVELSKVASAMLSIYLVFRAVDLIKNGGYRYLLLRRSETLYFWTEIAMMVVIPVILFSREKIRNTPVLLYWTACVQAMGFISNRLNVSITAMEDTAHANYFPKWPEMALTMMVIAAAVVAFRMAVLYLDVFPRKAKPERWLSSPASA